MSEQFTSTISALQATLQKQEQEVRETKRVINKLSAMGGADVPYPVSMPKPL